METKHIGYSLLGVGIVMLVVVLALFSSYQQDAERLGCYETTQCGIIDQRLNATHFVTGIIGFIVALGVYLSFFHLSEKKLLQKLDENEKRLTSDEKFDLISHMLGAADTEILKTIRDHKRIKQKRLQELTGYSKAKVSEGTSFLEDKGLISKEKAGRTNLLVYKGVKRSSKSQENQKNSQKDV